MLGACYPSPGVDQEGGQLPAPFPAPTSLAVTSPSHAPKPAIIGGRSSVLQGDPDFDPDSLAPDVRRWYDELWASLELPEQRRYIARLAASDNLYEYSRLVHTYVVSLLTGLRATGDLRLLDEADQISELMRAQLADSWRGTGNRESNRDGYLNWVWRNDTSEEHLGKDLHQTDEMGTHSLVAELAWAYASNKDHPSPAGVDYGERADFWLDYLQNHFEAKWRERNQVRWPRFPFINRPHMHETVSFIKYHYYMYRLTAREQYLSEAKRLSDLVYEEFRQVQTDAGPAFVWPRSIVSEGGSERYLMPTTYSSLVLLDSLDLHLEGFYGWADGSVPERFANTVSQFIIDNGSSDFARDVGGGQTRAGLAASSARDWERLTAPQFAIKPFALLSAWDDSGTIGSVAREVYADLPTEHLYLHIPVGMMIEAMKETVVAQDEPAE
ncbi:MAG: hypothetical protein WD314_04915 [Trueperaceae bacterium]